jgi:hypothetical protein
MPADNKTQVLIELQLEMKKLKGQMKEYMNTLKSAQKQVQDMTKENIKGNTEYLKSLKDLGKAQQEVSQSATKAEKQKQDAIKKTSRELQDQQKKMSDMAKAWDKIKKAPGGFGRGMVAGAGLSGLTQPISAKGAGGLVGRGISAGVGGIANFFMSGIANAYQQFMQLGQARGGLVGLGTPGQMRAGLRAGGGVGGAGLGFNAMETALQARGVGRATGNIGAVYRAQQFARAYGMDVGEAGGYMGMLRQAGYGFGGQVRGPGGQMQMTGRQGTREFQKIIEAGMISGLEKGRIGEFLQGVSSITSQLGAQLPGKINASGIAAQAAILGQSKLPGFQGARGMQLLGRINQAIQAPGGGEAGQAMMLQALGFGKPGGGTGYYEALRMQEQGLNDPRNLPKVMKEVYSQLGDPAKGGRDKVNQEANLALKEMFGISLRQAEELQNIQISGVSQEEKQKKIAELMESAKPIEEQALSEMKKGFGGVVKYTAGIFDRQANIGVKVAPAFMKLQDLQLRALATMVKWIPKLGEMAEHLKNLFLIESRRVEEALGAVFGKPVATFKELLAQQEERMQKAGKIPRAGEYQTPGQVHTAIAKNLSALIGNLQENVMAQIKIKTGTGWGVGPGQRDRLRALQRQEASLRDQIKELKSRGVTRYRTRKEMGVGSGEELSPEEQIEWSLLSGAGANLPTSIRQKRVAAGIRARAARRAKTTATGEMFSGDEQSVVTPDTKVTIKVQTLPKGMTESPGGNLPQSRVSK